jgi:uncharacterized membrane protein
MAYKTFLKIGSTQRAGIGFLPIAKDLPVNQTLKTNFTSASDALGVIQLNGVVDVGLFAVGNLVNIRYSDDSPSTDTTIATIGAGVITVTAPFLGVVLGGVLSQRFQPPQP